MPPILTQLFGICRPPARCRFGSVAAVRWRPMDCIWCGRDIEGAPDGASFLFLAKRNGRFYMVDEWLDRSPHLEGNQFYCHVRCFRASVPAEHQTALSVALDED